jgi:hypothetical protein
LFRREKDKPIKVSFEAQREKKTKKKELQK